MRINGISMILLTLVLIPAVAINVDGGKPDGPSAGAPTIEIVIDQSRYQVDVEPGADGVLRVTGTIHCDLPPSTPPGQYCIVNLQADAGGWPVSVPPAFVFDRTHEEEDFSIEIQVPIETSQTTTGQLSVSGRWSYSPGVGGGTVPASTAIILVKPYSRLAFSFDKENNTASVGDWGELKITITNEGNAGDEVRLSIDDVPEGLDAYLEEEYLRIPEKQSKTTILNFKQSSGTPGTYQISISAEGLHNGSRSELQHSVVVQTKLSFKSMITTPFVIIPLVLVLIVAGIIAFRLIRKKMKRAGATP